MSSIITSILSSTVGLLCNKARDKTAAKLKDGDITDAKIREIVVRELNDIKTKLDGLSRKDLLSSYSFLKEGVGLLNVSLNKTKEEVVVNEAQDSRDETSGMLSSVESDILNEASELSRAMEKLKIHSEEFQSAKKRFEKARETATHAFCNEALNIEDRIFAAKLRVISEILECLETHGLAITGCLSFLEDLHSLPAIQEMFSVYLNGGVKSLLNKAERVENVKSVMSINFVLFQFVSKLRSKYSSVIAWPTIELQDRTFSPILHWEEISTRKSMGEQLNQPPQGLLLDEDLHNPGEFAAVNGHGEIVVVRYDDIKVISKTGESKVVKLPDVIRRTLSPIYNRQIGIAVDINNKIYILHVELCVDDSNALCHLYVLDENYNLEHESTLGFLNETGTLHGDVSMAINKNTDIVMMKDNDFYVYVCDNTGQLKHKFGQHLHSLITCLSFTDKNEIVIASPDWPDIVNIYTEKGDMKTSIKLPKGHQVSSVAFHYVVCKIIVLSYVREQDSYFLLCHSATGELETSTFFCKVIGGNRQANITSHPSGHVAVVRQRSITYI